MPTWPASMAKVAKAWEALGCVLHYDRGWNGHGEAWQCWAHNDACPAIEDHQLRPAPEA